MTRFQSTFYNSILALTFAMVFPGSQALHIAPQGIDFSHTCFDDEGDYIDGCKDFLASSWHQLEETLFNDIVRAGVILSFVVLGLLSGLALYYSKTPLITLVKHSCISNTRKTILLILTVFSFASALHWCLDSTRIGTLTLDMLVQLNALITLAVFFVDPHHHSEAVIVPVKAEVPSAVNTAEAVSKPINVGTSFSLMPSSFLNPFL